MSTTPADRALWTVGISFLGKALLAGLLVASSMLRAQSPAPVARETAMPSPADRAPIVIKVLVLNYDPKFEGKRLHEVFRWNDPRELTKGYIADMEKAACGLLKLEVVEWRDLDEIYAREDGGRFTVEEYVKNRRAGSGWPEKIVADYPRIMAEQKVVPMIDDGRIDEVWIFSDHFFGLWEASMAGPGAFFVNGGVYPEVPSKRPFAFYGFNYERGVAEMIHNTSHRTECTMNRFYGQWNLKEPRNNWEKFSANHQQSNGVAGVGTCHWPANASGDYDYGNKREVESWADDFLDYPNLTGKTKLVSVNTWSRPGSDHHRDYMRWYFGHLPKAPGINPDGRLNNWWRYLYDFASYHKNGQPRPSSASIIRIDTSTAEASITIAYRSAAGVVPESCDPADISLHWGKDEAAKPASVTVSDPRPGAYRVTTYRLPAMKSERLVGSTLRLHPDQVKDLAASAMGAAEWKITATNGALEAQPAGEAGERN